MTNTLSLRIIRAHRIRSAAICLAVMLTTVLFSTVIGIAANIAELSTITLQLAAGSDFHGGISFNDLPISAEELLNRVKKEKMVTEAYIVSTYANFRVREDETQKNISAVSDEAALRHMFTEITDGRFPENTGEILINTGFYPSVKTGDTITLQQTDIFNNVSEQIVYTVCGTFTSQSDSPAQNAAYTLYEENSTYDNTYGGFVYIQLDNAINIEGKLDNMMKNLYDGLNSGTLQSYTNDAYLTASIPNAATIALTVFSAAIVFACAFLLIYNIYSIALTQDLRTLGMLGIIGTTYRQMKKMVKRQSDLLFLLSIIPGIVIGYFIGVQTLAPLFMTLSGQEVSYSGGFGTIVVSVILTYLTVTYSATRPLKRMKKLPLLRTLEYMPDESKQRKKSKHSAAGLNPVLLALNAAARDKRKLIVTSLSAALAITVFMLIGTLSELIEDSALKSMQAFDLIVRTRNQVGYGSSADIENSKTWMDREIYEAVRNSSAADEVYPIYITTQTIALSDEQVNEAVRALEAEKTSLADDYKIWQSWYTYLEQAVNGQIDAVFLGIPDKLWKYVTLQYFSGGKRVYADSLPIKTEKLVLSLMPSTFLDPLFTTFRYFTEGEMLADDSLKNSYTIYEQNGPLAASMLVRDIAGYLSTSYYSQVFAMPLSQYEEEFGNAGGLFSLSANAKKSREEELRAEITEVTKKYPLAGSDFKIEISGRLDDMADLKARLNAIHIVGYTLSVIIFCIGIINVVNYSMTQSILRRREYAMLESVGMTGTQLRVMIITENGIGTVLAALITFVLAVPIMNVLLTAAVGTAVPLNYLGGGIAVLVMALVSLGVSFFSCAMLKKSPITERIKIDT